MSDCDGCSFAGASTAVENAFVGIRFREETQLTLCSSGEAIYAKGQQVIVDMGDDGNACGVIEQSPTPVFKPCQKASASPIVRASTAEDRAARKRQLEREGTIRRYAREHARKLELKMKPTKVECDFAGEEATVYFTAEKRVDFRELVARTSERFGLRIRMQHLGPRDEAKLLGGIGVCGRSLCCSSWMKGCQPISIKMAKRQGLSLNPSKISGQCGRLLCCLAHENDQYPRGNSRRSARNAAAESAA